MLVSSYRLVRYSLMIGLAVVPAALPLQADTLFESFDGWSKPAYAGGSTYSNAASGVWYTENSTVMTTDVLREPAVRFNRSAPAPFLIYQGPAGDGLIGGIETVAFDYAHWNADGANVRFQLQYSTNAVDWIALDDEVQVTDFDYERYSWSGLLLDEPLYLRVQSTAHSERLLINDFEIHPFSEPRIFFATNALQVSISDGTIEVPVWIDPPTEATVDLGIIAGDEWRDLIFTLQETQLVFTAAAPTQMLHVALIETGEAIPDPIIVFALTNAVDALPAQNDQLALTILDNVLPRASLSPVTAAVLESGDPVELQVSLTQPGDATVNVHRAGSALEGVDYTLSATQLVFQAEGPITQTFTLAPIDNDIGDGDRTVLLTLAPLVGANAGDAVASEITIIDDEPFANFVEPDAWLSVGDEPHAVTVALDEARDAIVHIEVITDAVADWHYHLSATTLVFEAEGPTAQEVVFTPLDHGEPTPPQRLLLQLTGDQGFRPGSNHTHHVGIRSHLSVLIAAANLTSGSNQRYEEPGSLILRGLMPDVVGIQEFRVHGTRREFVDEVFGTNYHYVVEAANLPCGVISRWPIVAWGTWHDSVVGNRNPLWAIIDVPHLGRKLQVVSAHLYASGSATDRNIQAHTMINGMEADFDPFDYTVVAADLNTQNRSEAALTTLAAWVSDEIIPRDQHGNPNTNAGRSRPYDYVLPSPLLESLHQPLDLHGLTFTNGVIFDTRIWSDLPHPVLASDSAASGMQHMAVLKYFVAPTNQLLHVYLPINAYHFTADSVIDADQHLIYVQNLEETPMAYELISGSPWITIPLAGGTVQGSFPLGRPYNYDLTLLTEGVHTSRIDVVAPGADNGEQTAEWTTHVQPPFAHEELPDFLSWSSGGVHGSWTITNDAAFGEVLVLQSAPASWHHSSWLVAEVAGPGQVDFDWRFTAENGGMELRLNGELYALNPVSGVQESIAVPLPPGTHRLEWRFFEQSFEYAAHLGQVIGLTYAGEPDRDGDGLPDWWETLHFGSPTAADPMVDSDGDGVLNWQEFVAGTDPHDSNSYFRVEIDSDPMLGPHVLFPHTLTNRHYQVLGTDSLLTTNWISLHPPQPGTGGPLLIAPTNNLSPLIIRGGVSLPDH